MTQANSRTADYPIDSIFLERWSPRAFSDAEISQDDLFTMLEAARWAPSSSNGQPWRFIYALRNTPHWEKLLNILVPANQVWAKNASALVLFASNSVMTKSTGEKTTSPTHSFDAGTASGLFAMQALKMGWHTHGMAGFDRNRAGTDLNLPKEIVPDAVYAVGKIGDVKDLPEALAAKEKPSPRRPLKEMAYEGVFAGNP